MYQCHETYILVSLLKVLLEHPAFIACGCFHTAVAGFSGCLKQTVHAAGLNIYYLAFDWECLPSPGLENPLIFEVVAKNQKHMKF